MVDPGIAVEAGADGQDEGVGAAGQPPTMLSFLEFLVTVFFHFLCVN